MHWQIYSALVERCSITDHSPPAAPSFWRPARSEVILYKTTLKTLLHPNNWRDAWTDTGRTNASGNFEGEFEDHPVFAFRRPPVLTWSNACIRANLPTNFFDYTPWRCLSGLGKYTNDATVGHPYGYTNSYTAGGGTNFPGSRTNWYTTDYGFQGLKDVIDLLKWSAHEAGVADYTNLTYYTRTSNDWAGLRAHAIAYHGDPTNWWHGGGNNTRMSLEFKPSGTNYNVTMVGTYNRRVTFDLTDIYTNASHDADCYVEWHDGGETYHDFLGTAPVQTNFYISESFGESTATGRVTSFNMTNIAYHLPAVAPTSKVEWQQWSTADEVYFVLGWDGTNGIDYLE